MNKGPTYGATATDEINWTVVSHGPGRVGRPRSLTTHHPLRSHLRTSDGAYFQAPFAWIPSRLFWRWLCRRLMDLYWPCAPRSCKFFLAERRTTSPAAVGLMVFRACLFFFRIPLP
ncbi:uncharacterized protein BCR38DRAFT_417937 [Pseudomassariella vexata]|uniref:Uncharacterized protein n=1 Tax=Pseudomassariella vexata TaxID=1141098 RepID=A0A1Y2EJN7_9PEZI|nr:uncharacterized protein BCR38DRAFT_417937 [Pseudomassariella vexata]ORY71761.1 hypothetical protein BCR38DRAFT_417937 [Pseudomassariella vexata]